MSDKLPIAVEIAIALFVISGIAGLANMLVNWWLVLAPIAPLITTTLSPFDTVQVSLVWITTQPLAGLLNIPALNVVYAETVIISTFLLIAAYGLFKKNKVTLLLALLLSIGGIIFSVISVIGIQQAITQAPQYSVPGEVLPQFPYLIISVLELFLLVSKQSRDCFKLSRWQDIVEFKS